MNTLQLALQAASVRCDELMAAVIPLPPELPRLRDELAAAHPDTWHAVHLESDGIDFAQQMEESEAIRLDPHHLLARLVAWQQLTGAATLLHLLEEIVGSAPDQSPKEILRELRASRFLLEQSGPVRALWPDEQTPPDLLRFAHRFRPGS